MPILVLHGLKVLPPPDLDDGESLWFGRGDAATTVRWGGGVGLVGAVAARDDGGRLLCQWSLALRGRS